VQFDPIRHSLGDGVAPGGLGRITGLIDLSPYIPPNIDDPHLPVEMPNRAVLPGKFF
jgi:hypothetical protein